jgi:nucleotide-binding universal stress UspA family protein
MPTIIVPTDFSAAATNAANYAADLAATLQADLLLLTVVPITWVNTEIPTPDIYQVQQEAANTNITELKNKLLYRTHNRLNITTAVTTGDVVDEIKNLAEPLKPLAIVMGITGAGTASRTLFGSNTFGALHNLLFPIIVVPPTATYHHIKNIGLATDLTDVTNTIDTQQIKHLVSAFSATLHLLHVTGPDGVTSGLALPEAKNLQEALRPLHPQFHYQRADNLTRGVLEFIKDQHIHLLLTVPKHRGFFQSLFHHSAANNIAAHINIPMMTVHK